MLPISNKFRFIKVGLGKFLEFELQGKVLGSLGSKTLMQQYQRQLLGCTNMYCLINIRLFIKLICKCNYNVWHVSGKAGYDNLQ